VTGTPAISYRASINETYDNGFYRLPNMISHQCFSFDELRDMLQKVLKGEMGAADGDERQHLIGYHLAGKTGPLACERMLDVLDKVSSEMSGERSVSKRTQRWLVTRGLHLAKNIKSSLPGSHNRPEFQRHRYPGISLENLREKINQLQHLRGKVRPLRVEQVSNVIFKIIPN